MGSFIFLQETSPKIKYSIMIMHTTLFLLIFPWKLVYNLHFIKFECISWLLNSWVYPAWCSFLYICFSFALQYSWTFSFLFGHMTHNNKFTDFSFLPPQYCCSGETCSLGPLEPYAVAPWQLVRLLFTFCLSSTASFACVYHWKGKWPFHCDELACQWRRCKRSWFDLNLKNPLEEKLWQLHFRNHSLPGRKPTWTEGYLLVQGLLIAHVGSQRIDKTET